MEPNTFESSGLKAWQKGAIIAVVVIILAVVVYAFVKPKSTTDDTSANPVDQTGQIVDKTANNLVISDNYSGNTVLVQQIQLAKPGFVVIQKDEAGKPGKVIGYQYFDAGIRPGKIMLTENTVDGGKYWAVLYNDTGSDKKFDIAVEETLKDKAGSVIMKAFKTLNVLPEFKG